MKTARLSWQRLPVAFLALLAIAGLLAACSGSGGDEAQGAPPPPTVTVAAPLVQRITEWDEFTGRFEPTSAVEVRARVSGYLDAVKFQDGAMVKEGDVLFVIDPRPYQAAVDQAKGDLDSAERASRTCRDRSSTARRRSTGSPSISGRHLSTSACRSSEPRSAAVEQAKAALQAAQLNLDFTQVRAPISGRVSNRRIDVGNLVAGDPNSTLLTTIVTLDPLYFVFDMSEGDFLAYQRAVRARRVCPPRATTRRSSQARLPDERAGRTPAR